jgi:hypothetical protein
LTFPSARVYTITLGLVTGYQNEWCSNETADYSMA